jgi:hypothetical protein
MGKGHCAGVIGFGCGRFPCFCCTWPLLTSRVFLGKTLLPSLALPVVVAHTAAVDDQSASELSEHGSGSYDGNLSGPIRVGQNLLVDQVVLLGLCGNDFVQRSVLVEKEIRVAVAKDTRAFGCEHEEFVGSVGDEESAAAVLAAVEWVAGLRHLPLSGLVDFARYVFVAFGIELVGGVVAHSGQRLDDSGLGGCSFGGWGGVGRRCLGQRGRL